MSQWKVGFEHKNALALLNSFGVFTVCKSTHLGVSRIQRVKSIDLGQLISDKANCYGLAQTRNVNPADTGLAQT